MDRRSRIRARAWLWLRAAEVDDGFDGFAPPPYQTDEALLRVKRALRDLRLSERAGGFESRGCRVAEVVVDGAVLQARLARRATRRTPEWDASTLKNAADERKWLDELKRRLARWTPED
jgi:hypothetical protein